jgi:hypothetical protein
MSGNELTIRGTVRYAGDVGFGAVFRLTAVEDAGPVTAGEMVPVTVLAGDDRWAAVLHGRPEPALVEADFGLRPEDETPTNDYATASFSGFVDSAGRSWDLRDVRPSDG